MTREESFFQVSKITYPEESPSEFNTERGSFPRNRQYISEVGIASVKTEYRNLSRHLVLYRFIKDDVQVHCSVVN